MDIPSPVSPFTASSKVPQSLTSWSSPPVVLPPKRVVPKPRLMKQPGAGVQAPDLLTFCCPACGLMLTLATVSAISWTVCSRCMARVAPPRLLEVHREQPVMGEGPAPAIEKTGIHGPLLPSRRVQRG